MKKRITTILLVVFSVTVSVIMAPAGRCLAQADQPLPNRVNFNAHIRPILTENCYNCHGPDKSKVEAGLQLHNRTSAFAALGGDDDRHAIVAGNRAKSLLIERIRSDDPDERMPPPESKMTLSERDKQLLERWISEGANWQEHWSLIAPVAVTVPSVRDVAWPRNAYDAFILRELESRAITPSSELSKSAWLRRVTLDLTGLPPSPSERQAFLDDSTELAYERVIDRLLESDASAEQLTLHWLDNARFADSNGYQYDGPNDQWPWRNWVIDAFKSHMPFDQFVTEQLAGDLLPNSTFDQKIATAFNRNHGFTIEGGVTPEEYRVQYVNDRVMTFSTVFLGLTLECSRCHDHKFDDVTMHDFYSLSSFFDNIPGTGFWGGGLNTVSTPVIRYSTSDVKKVTRLKQQLVELQAEVERVIRQEEFPDFELWKKHLVDGERQAKVIKVSAADGVKVTDNKDGSWGFGGETNPDKTQIQFVLETEATDLRSLIVQPLPVNGKIGRSHNGQAVLSFIEATIESTRDTASSQRITFSSVIAASHVKKESAELALTADPDGWRLIRGAMPKQAIAVFSAPDQFGYKGGSRVTVTLHFESKFVLLITVCLSCPSL